MLITAAIEPEQECEVQDEEFIEEEEPQEESDEEDDAYAVKRKRKSKKKNKKHARSEEPLEKIKNTKKIKSSAQTTTTTTAVVGVNKQWNTRIRELYAKELQVSAQPPGTTVIATRQPDRLFRWAGRLKVHCDDLISLPTADGLRVSVQSRDKTTWIYANFVGDLLHHVTPPYSILGANLYRLCDRLNLLKSSDCLVVHVPQGAEELQLRVVHGNNVTCNETYREKLLWVEKDVDENPCKFSRPGKVRMNAPWFRGICERACRTSTRLLFEWHADTRTFVIASSDRQVVIEQHVAEKPCTAQDEDDGLTIDAPCSFSALVNSEKVKEFVKTDGKLVELKFECDTTVGHSNVSFHYQFERSFIHYIQTTTLD